MAIAAAALAGTADVLCGHADSGQEFILLGDDGKRYCGRCWGKYRAVAEEYRAGLLSRADVEARLATILAGFNFHGQEPDLVAIHAEAAAAAADLIEESDHAA